MPNCARCGKDTPEGRHICHACEESLTPQTQRVYVSAASSAVSCEEYALFVGKNSDTYLKKFAKFVKGNSESLEITWHWPAFFVPILWMLYRKLYGWAAIFFVLGFIPYLGLLFHTIIPAMIANYLYFKKAKGKISEIKNAYPSPETQRAVIAVSGGVSKAWVIIVLAAAIPVMGILAAIAIPQFAMYRDKANNTQAVAAIQSGCSIAQSVFTNNPGKVITRADLDAKGLKLPTGVELTILDGSADSLSMRAFHIKGSKIYEADKNCSVVEEKKQK